MIIFGTMGRKLPLLLFICFSFVLGTAWAQGSINAPKIQCLGDITNFTYTPPSGLTLSNITWDFGDGATSSTVSPSHTYASVGNYKVKILASFTNSSTAKDSLVLDVYGLPIAKFQYINSSDTCFNRNQVCYRDSSKIAATGQTIVSRLFVWGDGTFINKTNPPSFDSFCHKYPVPAKYSLRMEITDKYGCKSSATKEINILENVVASFKITNDFVDCQTAQVCALNTSYGAPTSNMHFRWYIDTAMVDSGFYFNNPKCIPYKASRSATVKLIAYGNSVCRDSAVKSFNLTVDALPTQFEISDTFACSTDESLRNAFYKPIAQDSCAWYLNNQIILTLKPTFSKYFSTAKLIPGTQQIKLKIFRGSCIHTLTRNIELLGPIGNIASIDNVQCFSNRKVYMYAKTLGSKREDCVYNWNIQDPYGDNCVKIQALDSNLYTNCNFSKDWFIKHKFQTIKNNSYFVGLKITDTTTGCSDSVTSIVYGDCSPILKPDSFHTCIGGIFKDNELPPYADSFSLDSGKSWIRFPSTLSNKSEGEYDIGFKFKSVVSPWIEDIGNDSIKIHSDSMTFYDTVFRKQLLFIHGPKKDSVSIKFYGVCSPFRASIHFKSGMFYKGEKLQIFWGDTGNIDIDFDTITHIDSVMHYYKRTAISGEIQVHMANQYGCNSVYKFSNEKGKTISSYTPKFMNCKRDSICFTPYIYNMATRDFWPGNTPNNKVRWYFPGENQTVNKFTTCHRFTKPGMNAIQMIVNDSFGCIDTLFDSVFVQDPHAGFRRSGEVIYCSELKQFFDSSSYLKNPKYHLFLPVFYQDSVVKYSWRFGDGVYNSFQKNPLQSLNTSLDSIQASHAIQMASGCTDTVHFTIKIIGPKPYFFIKDTVGCGSLEATFLNVSRNTSNYIWRFGDSANTILNVKNKNTLTFKYTKPGRYYISLTGIDTVFNPFTNKKEACSATYPDVLFQKDSTRSVLVLPFLKTGIQSIDTICVGVPFSISSLSDTSYRFDHWNMGDSIEFDTVAPSSFNYSYKKEGSFLLKLNPRYLDSTRNSCLDSAEKTIVVMGVKADFDIDQNTLPPLFKFYNKSTPASAGLNWDFGQPGPNNTSTSQNPQKDYGSDTGQFMVCLIARIDYGCEDTICKPIFNDHLTDFGIYNVFTPGKIDGLNDFYDIQIEGESFYQLIIYNRWGEVVYEADQDYDNTQPNGNWNGKYKNTGEPCPAGTYYYIFNYKLRTKPDTMETLEGVIHLIR